MHSDGYMYFIIYGHTLVIINNNLLITFQTNRSDAHQVVLKANIVARSLEILPRLIP